jgi:hypothetical protein
MVQMGEGSTTWVHRKDSEGDAVLDEVAESVKCPSSTDEDPPQLADGVKFAALYGELRRVREELECAKFVRADALGQLKVMREDRDEYLDLYRQTLRSYEEATSAVIVLGDDFGGLSERAREERFREVSGLPPKQMQAVLEVIDLLEGASEDEQVMALTYVQKLMGEGRSEHGKLDLAKDERKFTRESLDELDDVMSYLMMTKRRIELWREEQCEHCGGSHEDADKLWEMGKCAADLEQGADGGSVGRRMRAVLDSQA